jgi:hypothetical protein
LPQDFDARETLCANQKKTSRRVVNQAAKRTAEKRESSAHCARSIGFCAALIDMRATMRATMQPTSRRVAGFPVTR